VAQALAQGRYIHEALDNETPAQIAEIYNVTVPTLLSVNEQLHNAKPGSKLFEGTRVNLPPTAITPIGADADTDADSVAAAADAAAAAAAAPTTAAPAAASVLTDSSPVAVIAATYLLDESAYSATLHPSVPPKKTKPHHASSPQGERETVASL
jgi:hypothetical protein